jgi:HEAT repeat protein
VAKIRNRTKSGGERKRPTLDAVIEALQAGESENRVSSVIFYGLSGLTSVDIRRIAAVWEELNPDYRAKVMENLVEVGESNFELDYRAIAMLGLDDDNPDVRVAAIEALWEDQSLEIMDRLIDIALLDADIPVRAAAVSALGRFILAGELGELPESEIRRAQEAAINLLNSEDEDVDVRRRALEAISNSSHEIVTPAIENAYHSLDQRMRISSVFAMGRSCDDRWEDIVLQETTNPNPEMRYEAARACGELGISEAVPFLVRLSQEHDREIKQAAIWSLGEIGGGQALRVLGQLAEEAEITDDQDMLEAIEDAIGNASLVGADLEFDD